MRWGIRSTRSRRCSGASRGRTCWWRRNARTSTCSSRPPIGSGSRPPTRRWKNASTTRLKSRTSRGGSPRKISSIGSWRRWGSRSLRPRRSGTSTSASPTWDCWPKRNSRRRRWSTYDIVNFIHEIFGICYVGSPQIVTLFEPAVIINYCIKMSYFKSSCNYEECNTIIHHCLKRLFIYENLSNVTKHLFIIDSSRFLPESLSQLTLFSVY